MGAILWIVAVIVAYRFGWEIAHSTVARECEKLGGFYVGKKIYKCVAVEEVSHPPTEREQGQ